MKHAIQSLKKWIYRHLSADKREALFYYFNIVRDFQEFLQFRKKLLKYPPLFILQMGKVGSKSIYEALTRAYPGVVIHCHGLSRKPRGNWRITLAYKIRKSRGIPVKIITPVRDKLERSVSSFFYNAPVHDGISYEELNAMRLEQVISLFVNRNHRSYEKWFYKNYMKALGIDIFKYPFNKELGYITFREAQAECLIFQSELDDEKKSVLIRDFLDLADFAITKRTNKATNYAYKYVYFRFINHAVLPEKFISSLMDDAGYHYLYDRKHRQAIYEKWRIVQQ